ncbi:MAG TPA: phosphodiester glycosidase family protein [Sphingobacteriaceae bacterium]|nr:phosphodiester glycosidase family protein [Sphingobacteriaceae bacterium]
MKVLKSVAYSTAIAIFTLHSCKTIDNEELQEKSLPTEKGVSQTSAISSGGFVRIFKGIEYASGSDDQPRLQKAFAFKIDLKNPAIKMLATPGNGTAAGETNLQTTPAFLDAQNLKAAINTNFFTPSGTTADNRGLLISNGTIVSNAESGTFSSQLNFTNTMLATLISSADNPAGIYNAVGGAEIILKDGVNIGTNPDVQPRTAIGLSQDNRYLIMVVIDGRQTGWSDGVNHAETAKWLTYFGAYNGAIFDGGGSSILVRDNGSGTPTVLNRPSDGTPRAVSANLGVYSQPLYKHVIGDYNNNWSVEKAVYRSSNSTFYVSPSSAVALGRNGDIPVVADFDNDGSTNRAVWRPSVGNWYVMNAANTAYSTVTWGINGDIPVPADYNGDGTAERALFRPSNATWYLKNGVTGVNSSLQLGQTGDIPVPADYDGDDHADKAVYRPSNGTWYVILSTTNTLNTVQWGQSGDIPVPGDYDGNGIADRAVYRPSTGQFIIRNQPTIAIGQSGDIPSPGDYDGDGETECAIWRPSTATWIIEGQTNSVYGITGDIPLSLPSAIRMFFF